MADVSREDRGQLVLLTAISIAALLVLVAALLSTAVYTENVATRDTVAADARDAQLHRVAAVEAVADITDRSNRAGLDYDEFRAAVAEWDDQEARHAATRGADARVRVVSSTNGTAIAQSNATLAMTNATGNGAWELAAGVERVDGWQFTVNQSSLVAPGTVSNRSELEATGAFTVVVDDGAARWRAFLYRSGSDVVVHVDDGSLTTCSAPADANGTVTVDLSARTVAGADCSALAFDGTVGTPFDIAYRNGTNASGSYRLVVDQPVGAVGDDDYATAGGSPTATPHVSDVIVDVSYTTADLRYVVRNVAVAEEVGP